MVILRDYQLKLKQDIYDGWNSGLRNVLARSPTGSGKAFTLATLTKELSHQYSMPTCVLVHRKELVEQLCMTFATLGVEHNIIAQKNTITSILYKQSKKFGRKFYNPNHIVTIVSVDTLLSRLERYQNWLHTQRAWVLDECAHQLASNKWGKVCLAMPNAIGVGFTATPERLDKKGLGRHAFGSFDHMVHGPETRYLIGEGYLSNYKIVVPESNYRKYLKDDGDETKDYTAEARNYASMHSQITGDIVKTYIEKLYGKQTIVFVDSIEAGELVEKNFLDKGVRAKLLTGDTPPAERSQAIEAYSENQLQVLINVDLFDEGFDVPALKGLRIVEAVQMGRPTKSLGKYLQICGRALRPAYAEGYDLSTAEGRIEAQRASYKPYGIIVDHVGNIEYHGLPCKVRRWTLDNIVRRRDGASLMRICQSITCKLPFDKTYSACPYCGCDDKPVSRKNSDGSTRKVSDMLKMVDGDMALIDPETIREMEKEMELENPYDLEARIAKLHGSGAGVNARKKQQERIEMQRELAVTIAKWCAQKQDKEHLTERRLKKLFYLKFDATIPGALSLPRAEMLAMKNEIEGDIW